jgi:D-methionine transport system ATP-binding protein
MIEVTALTKRYGSLTVLDGIDFAVQAGEIAAVVGPSGAGKSTLARCINLLEKPTSGSILVDGKDLTHLSRRELRSARRAIGTVFQSASLLQRMTAAENVALPMRYLDISHEDRFKRVRSCRAGSSNGSALLAASRSNRRYCSPTSPPRGSTHRRPPRS